MQRSQMLARLQSSNYWQIAKKHTELRAHLAALIGLISGFAVAILAFGVPAKMAGLSALYGACFGLPPIGWIVLNIIFLHRLTEENGSFKVLQDSIANITYYR